MFTPVNMDKTRNFRYGMKAIDYIEKVLKKPISKLDLDNLTMQETAVVICAGLIHEDKKLNADKVMDIIDEKGNLTEVVEAMGKAFSEGFGVGTEEKN